MTEAEMNKVRRARAAGLLTIYREQMRERSSTGTILLIGALTIVNMVIAIAV